MNLKTLLSLAAICLLVSGSPELQSQEITTGPVSRPEFKIEVFDESFKHLIDPDAEITVMATGFKWSEGPLSDKSKRRILFTDVPTNKIWQIMKEDGKPALSIFMEPSGYDGEGESTEGEPGANGLAFDAEGRLIVCDHGNRRLYRFEADGKTKTTLVDKFEGKRFNSPNDLVIHSNGDIYFTDPPYGLKDESKREMGFFGVYCLKPDGKISLVTKDLVRPNGVTLSPDEKTLYVAQSHKPNPVYMKYAINDDGTFGAGEVLFDAKELSEKAPGMPDGIKVDVIGNIWATGPGGVLVISPEGKLLGRVYTGVPTANCAFTERGNALVMTAKDSVAIVRTRTYGTGDWTGDSKSTLLPRDVVDEISAMVAATIKQLDNKQYAELIEAMMPPAVKKKMKAEGKFDDVVKEFGEKKTERLREILSSISFSLAEYSQQENKVKFKRFRMDEKRGVVADRGIEFIKTDRGWIIGN